MSSWTSAESERTAGPGRGTGALHLAAFGDRGLVVADLVDALRDAVAPDSGLSLFAANADGDIVGHVTFTRDLLDARCDWLRWRCVTCRIKWRVLFEFWQSSGADDEHLAGGFDGVGGDGVQLVDLHDACDLARTAR